MKIVNKEEIDSWLFEHVVKQGHACVSIKGPLIGQQPGDDDPELHNLAWVDTQTGDRIDIFYGDEENEFLNEDML